MLARIVRLLAAMMISSCAAQPATPTQSGGSERSTAGGETPPEPVTTVAPEAHIRLIHAAIEARDQAVALVADAAATGDTTRYQFSSPYLSVTPGEHSIAARADEAELIQGSFIFPDGPSTLIAYSTGDFPVALALVSDSVVTADADTAQVRVFHAIVGQSAIDLCRPPESARADGTPIVTNIAPGTLGAPGYVSVASGSELSLQLRTSNPTPCHGRPFGVARFTPAAEGNYTLVLTGRAGRHRVAPELLFCADPPAADTSCASVSIEPP